MSAIELTEKIRELKELKAMAEDVAAEIATIEDIIKAEMTSRQVDEMSIDVFKVRWTPVTSTRFDSVSFKKTHGELYTQYSKQITSHRFTVV